MCDDGTCDVTHGCITRLKVGKVSCARTTHAQQRRQAVSSRLHPSALSRYVERQEVGTSSSIPSVTAAVSMQPAPVVVNSIHLDGPIRCRVASLSMMCTTRLACLLMQHRLLTSPMPLLPYTPADPTAFDDRSEPTAHAVAVYQKSG